MKKFKKIIPAFCMLLVSAVMLGSSTFAWFSMNNKVTATGMNVTAKSNTQYLIISGSADVVTSDKTTTSVAANKAEALTGRTLGNNNDVYPVAYNDGASAMTLYDAGKTGSERTVGVPSKGWYTAHSTKYDEAGNGAATDSTTLTNIQIVTDKLGNYVLEYNVWISVAEKSENISGNLSVTGTFVSADESVCALVTVGDAEYYFEKGAKTSPITKKVDGKSFTFNHDTPVKVTVRLFIDGNSGNVNSATTATLFGSLTLDFAVVSE